VDEIGRIEPISIQIVDLLPPTRVTQNAKCDARETVASLDYI